MRRPVLSQSYPNYSPPMPPVLNTGNSNSVIQQNIDSLKITNPEIYEKYKNDPKTLVYMANSFLEVAKDPEMTALEELEAPRRNNFLKGILSDPTRGEVIDQQKKDAEEFGEDYALDQRAKSLAAISRAQKDPTTTLFDDGNKVPSAYTEPVLYNNPEENDFGQLSKAKEPALLADFTSPMPTGARLDPYMDIPKVGQDDPIDDMVAGENLYPYTPTPDGHHRMPDGSIMPDSEMPVGARLDPYMEIPQTDVPEGVLNTKDGTKPKGNGILNTDTTSSNDRKGSAVSANARGSAMPFGKINRNEALMRIGGAIVGGSSQGFSGAMKAATDEFGNIKDANRQAETDAFNKAEATRLAEARIQAQKDKADKNKKAMGMPSAVYKQAALTAITDIKGRLANESAFNPFDNNTGLFGYAMSHVAGTDAHDTANAIDTIEASIGFDRLQKMRDDSPTGGALGQVSNIELALLRKSLGSLKQSSSRAQFVKNLNAIEVQYKKAVAAVEAQQREWYRMQGVDVPEPVTDKSKPAVVGGYSIVTKQK